MGSSNSFVLYFENEKHNQDEQCDVINLELPKKFKKSKLIFEPIFEKHAFHECILTLEKVKSDGKLTEYKDEIISKCELFKFGTKAYIKIRNRGECICKRDNNEKEKTIEDRIKEEINQQMESQRKEKKSENNKILSRILELLEQKNLKESLCGIKKEKKLDVNDISNSNIETSSLTSSTCSPPPCSSTPENNCFLIDSNEEFGKTISIYEKTIIYSTIKEQINDTYQNFLENLLYKDFQDKIFNFLDFKEMYDSIKKNLEDNLKKICEKITKTKHFNIVLFGREGVGKSTLLNSVLKLEGKNRAKTGVGDSVTLEIKKYSNPKMNFLRLYDTQGIGIKEGNSIKKIFSDISKLINEQIKIADPDFLIHCLWFCFNGRFGKLEMDILQELSKTYTDKTLPFIIVHTKTYNRKEAKDSIESIKNTYNIPDENICQVLAQDEDISPDDEYGEVGKKSFGINVLMKKTIDKIKFAVESANYQFTKHHIFIEIDKYLDSISKFEKINFNKENYLELSFNEIKGKLAEDFFNKANNLIKSITNKQLKKKTQLLSNFQLFLNDTLVIAESLFYSMIDEISKKHSPEIGRLLSDYNQDKENFSQNEKYFMFEYQDNLKNESYPLRKNIEIQVKEFIINELEIRVMKYFRLAIKQKFIEYAREKDKSIKELYEKFSQESIEFASTEIAKQIELSFPKKK